ncbi:MAG: hypothetical protein R3F60_04305 [bacterium]
MKRRHTGSRLTASRGRLAALALALLAGCDDGGGGGVTVIPGRDGSLDAAVDAAVDARTPDMAPPRPDAEPPAPDAAPVIDAAAPDQAVDAGPVIQCANGLDDDGDGQIDYPADPGCDGPADLDEADPAEPACRNGVDDDGDGHTDHPDDPGCASPDDPSEASTCGEHVVRDVSALRRVEGSTVGQPAVLSACRNNLAPEAIFLFTLARAGGAPALRHAGTTFDTLLQVRRSCEDEGSEVACNDDARPGERTSAVDLDRPARGDYYVILDGFREEQGDYVLNIRASVRDGAPCPEGDGPVQCRAGALCQAGVCTAAACANGRDDDGDGRSDYPEDPGCTAPDDDDETSPDPLPQCADGVDNDRNGQTDFPEDANCDDAADNEEARPPQCRDRVDNDGDGLVDLDDPGCQGNPDFFSEFNIEACRDGADNDQDGLIDYPADPGCETQIDPDETDPDPLPACSDGIDNDGDGQTDYPDDAASCLWAADPDEDDPCLRREPTEITGLADARGNTAEGRNDFEPECRRNSGREDVLLWRVREGRALNRLILSTRGSDFDTVLSVRDRCDAEEDVACNDNGGPLGTSFIRLPAQAPGTDLWIFVDGGFPQAQGIWRLSITAELAEGSDCSGRGAWVCGEGLACREGADGPRCAPAACANGRDDDGDGVTDFPAEPGCASASDDDEADPALPSACSNGVDDDQDGAIDFPADDRCAFAADPFEGPDCRDGVDNDGDGTLDYDRDGDGFRDRNGDTGCACDDDPTEEVDPQCADGCDNDRDGLIDLEDPGCNGDPSQNNEFNVAQCRDGIDNNGDGLIDFPLDPGCASRNDPLEELRDPLPACADGIDNDGDGRTDFRPDALSDDGCQSAADDSELGPCDGDVEFFPDDGILEGSTVQALDNHDGTCRPGDAPDVMRVARVPYLARVTISSEGSAFDTVVYARSACAPQTICPADPPPGGGGGVDGGVDDAGLVDAGVDDAGAVDAAVDAGAAPICEPMDTELACEDDSVGLAGVVEFDWDGGDIYAVLDGFGSASGNYRFTAQAVYRRGGQCGPEMVGYARCPAGFECRPDPLRGVPTCQAAP